MLLLHLLDGDEHAAVVADIGEDLRVGVEAHHRLQLTRACLARLTFRLQVLVRSFVEGLTRNPLAQLSKTMATIIFNYYIQPFQPLFQPLLNIIIKILKC